MRSTPTPELARGALHVFALAAFAIAQPLFDLLGRNVEFLVAHHVGRGDLVLLAVLVALGPASVVVAGLALTRVFSARAAVLLLLGVVGVLATFIVLPPLDRADMGAVGSLGAALAGVGLAFAYARSTLVRSFLTALSPAVAIFPLLFLFGSPASALLAARAVPRTLQVEVERPTPVVLLVFDAFPLFSLLDGDGNIDRARFPSFAAFAAGATWYRNASSVAEQTVDAVPSILTGVYPSERRLATLEDHPHNLFALLGGSYALNVVEANTFLCPQWLCAETATPGVSSLWRDVAILYSSIAVPSSLRGNLPDVTQGWRDFGNGPDQGEGDRGIWDVKKNVGRFLDGIGEAPEDSGVLHYLHAMVPHWPWRYLPSGAEYDLRGEYGPPYGPRGGAVRSWFEAEWAVDRALQRHLLQARYADRLLGEVLDRLRERGLYEAALVIVTADHGDSFWPGEPARLVKPRTASDVLNVPLIVKLPNQRSGEVSDRNVETVDILPTIAHILRLALPSPVDGHSLLDRDAPERPQKLAFLRRPHGVMERIEFGRRIEGLETSVERVQRLFGPGDAALFRIGPHPELIGRAVSELSIRASPGVSVSLERARAYAAIDLTNPFLPARIAGMVQSEGARPPRVVAIALNGRVEAVTRTFGRQRRAARFAAVVPERSLRNGQNEVEIFAIEETPEGPVLHSTSGRERANL